MRPDQTRLLFVKTQDWPAGAAIERRYEQLLTMHPQIRVIPYYVGRKSGLFSELGQSKGADCYYLAAGIATICEQQQIDAVLLMEGYSVSQFNPGVLGVLKRMGIQLLYWATDDPYRIDEKREIATYMDVILTVDRSCLPVYRALNPTAVVEVASLGANPFSQPSSTPIEANSDICFIGAPFEGSYRLQIIGELSDYLAQVNTKIRGAIGENSWQNRLLNYSRLQDKIEDRWISESEAVTYYRAAKINLVIHRDSVERFDGKILGNPQKIQAESPCERMFNIAYWGGFQIVDNKRRDLKTYFEPGKEIETFQDANDLKAKCQYYLNHPKEREKIAKAGQKKAKTYTYDQQLQTHLLPHLKKRTPSTKKPSKAKA